MNKTDFMMLTLLAQVAMLFVAVPFGAFVGWYWVDMGRWPRRIVIGISPLLIAPWLGQVIGLVFYF